MKELETEEGARLDDAALLSDTLKGLVARLASRLHEEAQAVVGASEARHRRQQAEWKSMNDQQASALAEAEDRATDLEQRLCEATQQRSEAMEAVQAAAIQTQRLEQQVKDLEALIEEKSGHIQSLEEKHRHGREALEHYRQSVKDRREQDQRRHDQQIQQLQAEQLQLNQTLSVKQSDITQLNKDNARLVTEVAETRKQLTASENKVQGLIARLRTAEDSNAAVTTKLENQQEMAAGQAESLLALNAQQAEADKSKHALEIEIAKLRAELDVKNQVFEKMGLSE